MKRILIATFALATIASAACRVYDVDVYQNVNGKAPAADGISQSFTCTVDSLLWASIFIGAANSGGSYSFEIRDRASNDLMYSGQTTVTGQNYAYVKANLQRYGSRSLVKGSTYLLKVTLQSSNPNETLNYYYSDQNPYNYGHLIEPGQDQSHPEEYYWKDLSCRIEGIVYNNPEMVSTWDMIPAHLVNFRWHPDIDLDSAQDALENGAAKMQELGVRGNRIVDLWGSVQPDSDSLLVFKWDTVDFCWRTLANRGVHPHLVAHGGGAWRLDESLGGSQHHDGYEGNMWPRDMFESVLDGGAINPKNHLAWFFYNYAKRYGPVGYSKNSERTGTFWLQTQGVEYLPLQYVELCNEPTYDWRSKYWGEYGKTWDWWWQGDDGTVTGRILDPDVVAIRQNNNWGDAMDWDCPGRRTSYEIIYSRYCAVLDSAVKFACESINTEIYCPSPEEGGSEWYCSGVPTGKWLDELYQHGAGRLCNMVSFHNHRDPAESENSAVDLIYDTLRVHQYGGKLIALGEAAAPESLNKPTEEHYGAHWRGRYLTETFATFWGRNANPKKPVAYYDWQSFSSWFVVDGTSYDYGPLDNAKWIWGITDAGFQDRSSATALKQTTDELAGKQFCQRLDPLPDVDTGTAILEFQNVEPGDSHHVWVAWRKENSVASSATVQIPARTAAVDTVTVSIDPNSAPVPQSVNTATSGYLTLEVGKSPVFIQEPSNSALSRPDLVVDSVWTTIVRGHEWPQKRYLWAKVRNIGNAPSPATAVNSTTGPKPMDFFANGSLVASAAQMPGIQVNEGIYVRSDSLWQIAGAADQMVKAAVNDPRSFVELNWDNNAKYGLFQILPILDGQGSDNGGRHIGRFGTTDPPQLLAEFLEGGKPAIYYTADPDTLADGWSLLGSGRRPALALDATGNAWCTFVSYAAADSGETLYASVRQADGGFKRVAVYCASAGRRLGSPSLAVLPNGSGRLGSACVPLFDSAAGHSKLIYVQFDSAGSVKQNVVADYAGSLSDSACGIAVLGDTAAAVYAHGDSIFMRRLVYSTTTGDPPPDTWPGVSLVSIEPSPVTRHPFCEMVGSRLWVTYSLSYLDGGLTYWAVRRTSCDMNKSTITWEGTASVSANDANLKDFASLSGARVVVWAESSGTHWHIRANVSDSILTFEAPDSNAKFVSAYADSGIRTTPSTSTTTVYYTWMQQCSSAGDSWATRNAGKQILQSNAEANVTRYNEGRKLVRSSDAGGDSLDAVYRTSQGSIDFSTKRDGEEGWTSSLLRSTGDAPALDLDYLNRIWVCDRDFQGLAIKYDILRCQTRAAGSGSWFDFQVYSSLMAQAGSTIHKIGPPAIVACCGDTGGQGRSAAYIAFTVYEPPPFGPKTTLYVAKVISAGLVYVDTLKTVQNYGDSFPSIALRPVGNNGYGLSVAWQSGTEVYVKKTTNQDQPQFTTKRTWSNGYNLSNSAASSRHAQIAADDTVLVTWVEGDSGAIYVKGQGLQSNYDAWGSPVNVSACPDTVCDGPSIALGDSNIVTWQKKLSSTNYDIMARVNFHTTINLSNTASKSTYPHSLFHMHDGSPIISTVWTEELSTNYAEVGYKRWQLGEEGGGNTQSASVFDPSIRPMLYAPSPNPFAGTTTVRYATNTAGRTSVVIHDVTGRRVCNLMTTYQRPGIYNVTWTGRDDRQRQLPEGIYFVRLSTPNYCEARKLILTQ
jgi:hypothetical protein